ncbi:MAG: ABC transporter substrate-binding protein [Actinomycetaceae bacterium]|nr:ABC transporter substrate-binding protein [Actinomycetaceae bacterium]
MRKTRVKITQNRPLNLLGATLVAALALSGCGQQTTSATDDSADPATPAPGGTLVYASGDAEPKCLDPHVGGNYPQGLISSLYLETLFNRGEDGAVVPGLAESFEVSDDGLTHTLKIRSGVKFQDGTYLDAAAVKTNIEHLQNPDTASSTGYLAVRRVQGMETPDANTLVLTLSEPDNSLEESLSMIWTAIQSPQALALSKDENCQSPVGTGPFQVGEWKQQESVSFTRYQDYQAIDGAGPAYLDGITWRFIPEAATRIAALKSGEVDVIDNAQPDAIAQAEKSDDLGHLDAPRPGASNRLELNSGQAPFDDVKVREAFIRSVDVDGGVKALFFDTAKRSHSLLSSKETTGVSKPDLFTPDAQRANQLLDEAGWKDRDSDGVRMKDGERLTLLFPVSTNQSIPAEQSLFEQFQAQAKEVGFDVQIKAMDLSSWYAALAAHEYNLVSAPYTKVGPSVLEVLFHSSSTKPAPSGYFANNAHVVDPAIDELFVKARAAKDEDERTQLYGQAQEKILGGYYVLPLYDQQNHFLYRASVHGLEQTTAVATPLYTRVWMDK